LEEALLSRKPLLLFSGDRSWSRVWTSGCGVQLAVFVASVVSDGADWARGSIPLLRVLEQGDPVGCLFSSEPSAGSSSKDVSIMERGYLWQTAKLGSRVRLFGQTWEVKGAIFHGENFKGLIRYSIGRPSLSYRICVVKGDWGCL
jgi:hypothetical protein